VAYSCYIHVTKTNNRRITNESWANKIEDLIGQTLGVCLNMPAVCDLLA